MLPDKSLLRQQLRWIIADYRKQGHDVEGLHEELTALPESYDALDAFAHRIAERPLLPDWPYVEPDGLEEIEAECDPSRPLGPIASISLDEAAARIEAAFLGSMCGCILGKPLELNLTLDEIRRGLEARGEWPLSDYISRDLRTQPANRLHSDHVYSCRENIRYVGPDDDINYTVLGMLNLEKNGADFTWADLRRLWLRHQCMDMVWGSERTIMIRCCESHMHHALPREPEIDFVAWRNVWNAGSESCGAMIRADAYGYACAGNPALAARLAWREATFTHRRTGVYATMFTAAAISAAFVSRDPLEIFSTALKFVPRRSRFYKIASDSLEEISRASDWLDGYGRIHGKYKEYTHCHVYQECGTLMNTLRFAESVDDGFCKQVSQGNDTDSFGATSGSILGAYFGPGHLDARWLAPFNDEIRTGLSLFPERSLSALAKRMGELPRRLAEQAAAKAAKSP